MVPTPSFILKILSRRKVENFFGDKVLNFLCTTLEMERLIQEKRPKPYSRLSTNRTWRLSEALKKQKNDLKTVSKSQVSSGVSSNSSVSRPSSSLPENSPTIDMTLNFSRPSPSLQSESSQCSGIVSIRDPGNKITH